MSPVHVVWCVQNKKDDGFIYVENGELIDKSDANRIAKLHNMVAVDIEESGEVNYYFQLKGNEVRGYLLPDRKGPRGRFRTASFFVYAQNVLSIPEDSLFLDSLRKLNLEISEGRINDFIVAFKIYLAKKTKQDSSFRWIVCGAISLLLGCGLWSWLKKIFKK